jgi:hypothetical protein
MKFYKFRSVSEDSFEKVRSILTSGKFWFSSLWEQNDSLEGVYLSSAPEDGGVFDEKNQFKICSFSTKEALQEPLMWAHYANGFKGLAIEIEADNTINFHKVKYQNEFSQNNDELATKNLRLNKIIKIITHKTSNWEYESEFRCIKKMNSPGKSPVGRVTGVYFGAPFKGILNRDQVFSSCVKLQTYQDLSNRLKDAAALHNLECFEAHLGSGDDDGPKVLIDKISG